MALPVNPDRIADGSNPAGLTIVEPQTSDSMNPISLPDHSAKSMTRDICLLIICTKT